MPQSGGVNQQKNIEDLTNHIRETDDGDGNIDDEEFYDIMTKVYFIFKQNETMKNLVDAINEDVDDLAQ